MEKRDTKEFVRLCQLKHGDKYNYDATVYVRAHDKVWIWCSIHKEYFHQSANCHLRGRGCFKCGLEAISNYHVKSQLHFLEDAFKIHGNKYDYSLVEYKNSQKKINIICNNCGISFWQLPNNHLIGKGCKPCADKAKGEKRIQTTSLSFIERANKIHNNEYNYSLVIYNGMHKNIIIICPTHGTFNQTPSNHLAGKGCSKCIYRISKSETEWLNSLNNPGLIRNETINIGKKRIHPDAFDPATNTIYEFYGTYYHGHPEIHNPNDLNPTSNKTFGELYQLTLKREKLIKEAGYNLITIWENDWNNLKKKIE